MFYGNKDVLAQCPTYTTNIFLLQNFPSLINFTIIKNKRKRKDKMVDVQHKILSFIRKILKVNSTDVEQYESISITL